MKRLLKSFAETWETVNFGITLSVQSTLPAELGGLGVSSASLLAFPDFGFGFQCTRSPNNYFRRNIWRILVLGNAWEMVSCYEPA